MKKELKQLMDYMNLICKHWTYSSMYITLSVLLQNMAHEGKVTDTAYDVIKQMHVMNPKCHVTKSILDELDCLSMAERYKDISN